MLSFQAMVKTERESGPVIITRTNYEKIVNYTGPDASLFSYLSSRLMDLDFVGKLPEEDRPRVVKAMTESVVSLLDPQTKNYIIESLDLMREAQHLIENMRTGFFQGFSILDIKEADQPLAKINLLNSFLTLIQNTRGKAAYTRESLRLAERAKDPVIRRHALHKFDEQGIYFSDKSIWEEEDKQLYIKPLVEILSALAASDEDQEVRLLASQKLQQFAVSIYRENLQQDLPKDLNFIAVLAELVRNEPDRDLQGKKLFVLIAFCRELYVREKYEDKESLDEVWRGFVDSYVKLPENALNVLFLYAGILLSESRIRWGFDSDEKSQFSEYYPDIDKDLSYFSEDKLLSVLEELESQIETIPADRKQTVINILNNLQARFRGTIRSKIEILSEKINTLGF